MDPWRSCAVVRLSLNNPGLQLKLYQLTGKEVIPSRTEKFHPWSMKESVDYMLFNYSLNRPEGWPEGDRYLSSGVSNFQSSINLRNHPKIDIKWTGASICSGALAVGGWVVDRGNDSWFVYHQVTSYVLPIRHHSVSRWKRVKGCTSVTILPLYDRVSITTDQTS